MLQEKTMVDLRRRNLKGSRDASRSRLLKMKKSIVKEMKSTAKKEKERKRQISSSRSAYEKKLHNKIYSFEQMLRENK